MPAVADFKIDSAQSSSNNSPVNEAMFVGEVRQNL